MDIHRFFQAHHNPRLYCTALRQQELCELEQVAAELLKGVRRAKRRTKRKPRPPILSQHFDDIIRALEFVEYSIQTLSDAHEGDTIEDLRALISEREDFSGWGAWTSLHKEHIHSFVDEKSGSLQVDGDRLSRSFE